jgi:hypothetical protein
MHRLRRDTQAETRRLLRVLFLRLGSLPAGPGRAFGRDGRRLLRRRIAIKQYRSKLTRLAAKPAKEPARLGDPLDRRYRRPVRARPCSNDYLDDCPELDGNGVHAECKTVQTQPLPLHGPILSRDDRAGRCAWFWLRLGQDLRLADIGRRYSARKRASVVGNRTVMLRRVTMAGPERPALPQVLVNQTPANPHYLRGKRHGGLAFDPAGSNSTGPGAARRLAEWNSTGASLGCGRIESGRTGAGSLRKS